MALRDDVLPNNLGVVRGDVVIDEIGAYMYASAARRERVCVYVAAAAAEAAAFSLQRREKRSEKRRLCDCDNRFNWKFVTVICLLVPGL